MTIRRPNMKKIMNLISKLRINKNGSLNPLLPNMLPLNILPPNALSPNLLPHTTVFAKIITPKTFEFYSC